jgi:hypothetical protein
MLDGSQHTVAITSTPGSLVYFMVQVGDSNASPLSQYQLYEDPIAVEKTGTRILAMERHGALTSNKITTSDPYIVIQYIGPQTRLTRQ